MVVVFNLRRKRMVWVVVAVIVIVVVIWLKRMSSPELAAKSVAEHSS